MNGSDMNEDQQYALDGIEKECQQAQAGGFFSLDYVMEKLRVIFYSQGYDVEYKVNNERRMRYLETIDAK